MTIFTPQEIKNWEAYERLRRLGHIHMSNLAIVLELSGLSLDEYTFCVKNYGELKAQYEREIKGK